MFSPASVCLSVCECICPQDISRMNHRIVIKLIGYYKWTDGTNWLNFGEAAINCLRLIAQTLKQPYLPNQLRYLLEIWYAAALGISPTHITRRKYLAKWKEITCLRLIVCKICKNQIIRLTSNFHVSNID